MAETKEIRTQLRIPADLYEAVVAAAQEAGRSMNAEIVVRLERTFPRDTSAQILDLRHKEVAYLRAWIAERSAELSDLISRINADGVTDARRKHLQTAIERAEDGLKRTRSRLSSAQAQLEEAMKEVIQDNF